MINIRKGLFETNSSSVHSMVLCDVGDYNRWLNGELLYNINHDDPYAWKYWDSDKRIYVDTIKGMPPAFVTPEQAAYWDENYPYPPLQKDNWGGYELDFKDKNGKWCSRNFLTWEEYDNTLAYDYETFDQEYVTPSGEQVMAFGFYGHD